MDYLTRTGRKRTTGKKLLGVFEADETLLYTPLLRWYIKHGLELQAVYTTIEYQPEKILAWFVDEEQKHAAWVTVIKRKLYLQRSSNY